ncbi:MAG: RsmF rRNA methyltransferase first C-terminal domain-containing protein [Catenibacterium mitsuokai]|uniref:RsmB/NOP family class I SAM-dependent RNA methyltransferase n=1 Tax=Catenibacterium TaxID=135858 RepID=UPI0006C367F7|nr:RsmF rRNA methyltransferase first C-terminal domain-containing protein [Catenibacterium mitsuokai]CUP70720.1 Ribosomal RNA small subunit methyltransferase F [Roseburia hominis]MDD6596400.1 RsmF rRNA methyltransferase first C-terminal domain-containing protein [Catenibacterium mitsuokai]MDY3676433.1 RsmF rRNA methyltransferase first C-terminal domain-containing protein [Catenibacterium mitsuokai]MEE0081298.1 RsmF rRNA methyltransferase first C-terminal domain-containing protein [Catenibacteri
MEQFDARMKSLLKDEYDDFKKALLEKPVKGLYLNRNKKNVERVLEEQYIEHHPIVENGYLYDENYHPGRSAYFLAGLYYIQEPSAMLVADALPIEPDDFVLDMCAAPGGKSCEIASRLTGEGVLIANDIEASRARILSENIERFGLDNTIVTNVDPMRFTKQFQDAFDKIVLDAPCSGEGMFRKLEQAVDTWSEDKVLECAHIQKNLLKGAYDMLKQGGMVIYSTCTYSYEENEAMVHYAVDELGFELLPLSKSHGLCPGVDLDEVVRCYPHHYRGEGHFIALLRKPGNSPRKVVRPMKPQVSPADLKVLKAFYQETLNKKVPAYIIENNGHLYAIKKNFPELKGIRVLRNGLYLGEVRKNRFIPSYSLALTLTKEDVKRSYDYSCDSEEIKKYIHGETLEGTGNKGFGVIFVDGYPLSFYKESNQVKNLFPKGLRR